jgi:hypothetical protein
VVGLQRSELFTRRLPPPWSIEEYNDACFVVIDSAGQKPGSLTQIKVILSGRAENLARPVQINRYSAAPA